LIYAYKMSFWEVVRYQSSVKNAFTLRV
jgi:hypothetical protein